MCQVFEKRFLAAALTIVITIGLGRVMAQSTSQVETFEVTVDPAVNGRVTLSKPSGSIEKGTKILVKAVPDAGYAVDSVYYSVPGRWGVMYFESMTRLHAVTVDQDKHIGASFIKASELEGFKVIQNVVYAKPGAKALKYDVFSPIRARALPCIVIIHGGGWSANTEDIMRGLARELVRNRQYVVCSIDYRWIGNLDGDEESNTMANLIEDVYGAIAHIQEHAKEYGCDPGRIAVTGDSAGGHLSAAAANMVEMIGDGGFGLKEGVHEYKPTYMPKDKSMAEVRKEIARAIQAAAPSYGVFGGDIMKAFTGDQPEAVMKAISPIDQIPNVKNRAVPQYLLRGTSDMLIRNELVQPYADALKAAGQTVKYVQVEGANHAFFDWKPDEKTKATFAKYGVPYAAQMKSFFDAVFYRK